MTSEFYEVKLNVQEIQSPYIRIMENVEGGGNSSCINIPTPHHGQKKIIYTNRLL